METTEIEPKKVVNSQGEPNNEPTEDHTLRLYQAIINFYKTHIDFVDYIYYIILASFTLLTWRIKEVQELSYLAFVGVPRSGKTRALECLGRL